jgi:hypothetical protein
LNGGDGGFDIAVPRNHDDRKRRMVRLDDLQQLQPIEPRALQPDVEKDEMRAARLDGGKRLIGVLRRARAMALVGQNARDNVADIGFVINYKNIGCHLFFCSLANSMRMFVEARFRQLFGSRFIAYVRSCAGRREIKADDGAPPFG